MQPLDVLRLQPANFLLNVSDYENQHIVQHRQYRKSYEPEPVNKFFFFIQTFFYLTIFANRVFFARRPLRLILRGRGAKNATGLYSRLAAQTPIRAHYKAAHQTLYGRKVLFSGT